VSAVLEDVLGILDRSLSLGGRARRFNRDTPLLGAVPELDSMAVVNVIAAIEEHFGVHVPDDDISADTFQTVGSLAQLVESKLNATG